MNALEKKNRLIQAVREICVELGYERYAPWVMGGLAWLSEEKLNKVYEILRKWVK